jgi:hypothetical protein
MLSFETSKTFCRYRLFFGKSQAQDFEEEKETRNFRNATPPPS